MGLDIGPSRGHPRRPHSARFVHSPQGGHRRTVTDHHFKSAYIFGAVCPQRDTGVALVMTRVSTEAMGLMLAEISQAVPAEAHAIVVLDGAGWHIANDLEVPANLTLLALPPYSPELNAIERLWQLMRASVLSHRLFTDTKHIIDACCRAWNALIRQPGRIRSTCGYPWARQVETS